jgi:hypothetical protein
VALKMKDNKMDKNKRRASRAHYVLFRKDSPFGHKVVKNRKKYNRKKLKNIYPDSKE